MLYEPCSLLHTIHIIYTIHTIKTDLYGLQFYKDLHRVLKKGGVLFHYIGNPSSKESGRLYKGIKSRLGEVGFVNIEMVEAAFGMVATTS